MNIEETIAAYDRRVYGGTMPAHARQTLRAMLLRQARDDEKWAELSVLKDYCAFDEGMHWSDEKLQK